MTRHEFVERWLRALPHYRITPADMDVVLRAEGLGTFDGLPETFPKQAVDFLERSNWGVSMKAAINNVNMILNLREAQIKYPQADNGWAEEARREGWE